VSTSDWVAVCIGIAGVIAAIAAMPPGSTRKPAISICIGLILLALIIGIVGSTSKNSSANNTGASEPQSTVATPAVASPAISETASAPKTPVNTQPAITYLSTLNELSGEVVPSGPMVLDGTTYANSICFCSPGEGFSGGLGLEGQYQTYSFSFDLGGNYQWFNATIGLIDGQGIDPTGVVLFTVQVDNNAPAYSGSATIYKTHSVHVSVAGGIRLTLTMEMTNGSDPEQSISAPAWGNALLQ
jgi:hypothetical protein